MRSIIAAAIAAAATTALAGAALAEGQTGSYSAHCAFPDGDGVLTLDFVTRAGDPHDIETAGHIYYHWTGALETPSERGAVHGVDSGIVYESPTVGPVAFMMVAKGEGRFQLVNIYQNIPAIDCVADPIEP